MPDSKKTVPDPDPQIAHDAHSFTTEISGFLSGYTGLIPYGLTSWPAIQCQLEKKFRKLPTKVTLECIVISVRRDGGVYVFLTCPSSNIISPHLISTCKLDAFLYILRACGVCSKEVKVISQIDQSTDTLLKSLENACLEVPSLHDLCLTRVRSELPQPVSDEILDKTELPKTLHPLIRLDHVMTILKDVKDKNKEADCSRYCKCKFNYKM